MQRSEAAHIVLYPETVRTTTVMAGGGFEIPPNRTDKMKECSDGKKARCTAVCSVLLSKK